MLAVSTSDNNYTCSLDKVGGLQKWLTSAVRSLISGSSSPRSSSAMASRSASQIARISEEQYGTECSFCIAHSVLTPLLFLIHPKEKKTCCMLGVACSFAKRSPSRRLVRSRKNLAACAGGYLGVTTTLTRRRRSGERPSAGKIEDGRTRARAQARARAAA